jgi:hypothetical protein
MADDKRGKGFAGLQSLLPDVDAELKQAKDASAQAKQTEQKQDLTSSPPRVESAPSSSDQAPPTNQKPGSATFTSGPGMVWVGIVVLVSVLGFVALYKESENKSRQASSAAQPSLQPSWESAPLAAPSQSAPPAPQPSAARKSRLVPLEELDTARNVEPPTVPSRPSAPAPSRLDPSEFPPEERPPIGQEVLLNTNQIRYCLFEKVRLGALDDVVDKYSRLEVDGYNEMVRDFNSRCGSFRYRKGAIEPVRAEVEVYRRRLEAEAHLRISRWRSSLPESGDYVGNLQSLVLA